VTNSAASSVAARYSAKNRPENTLPTARSAAQTTASVALAITNLLDRRYYSYAIRNAAGTSFNAYPERPRAIMLSMQYDLP